MKYSKKTRQRIKALKQERTTERFFFGTSQRRMTKCDCGSAKLFSECCGNVDFFLREQESNLEKEGSLNNQHNYELSDKSQTETEIQAEKDLTHE